MRIDLQPCPKCNRYIGAHTVDTTPGLIYYCSDCNYRWACIFPMSRFRTDLQIPPPPKSPHREALNDMEAILRAALDEETK